MPRRNQRSEEARHYRSMYATARWCKRRDAQLEAEPLCRMCSRMGYVVEARVADHVTPHRGDEKLFYEGELQSLCAPHHDVAKQRDEVRGFIGGTDENGFPVDPKHHWNA